jgi:antitoxin component YwqK of YwqJK toxin-antitoxin module
VALVPLLTFSFSFLPAQTISTGFSSREPSRDIRPQTEYDSDGTLRLKYEFYHDLWSERDVKHGKYAIWTSNDRLTTQGFYFDGLQDSLWQYWYLNGKRKEVSWWEAGNRHGKTTLYDKEGQPTQEINYQNGQQEGLTICYHTNGKVKEIAQYHQGHRHGNVTTYTKKGIRKRIYQYEEGRKQRMPKPEKQPKPEKEPKPEKGNHPDHKQSKP